ncbi:MAG: Iron-sulfur cluster repair protein YtfE [Candidatus Omnitrophica bacterium]|nr:Iron-sulfur cluster repair protein YtfE [Candidatus Omnitrophota bacterium]
MPNKDPLTAYFEADHDRLDALLERYRALKSKDHAAAKPYFREFIKGLRRHIVWEEEVLFPHFEQRTGIVQGPTHVMRHEHRSIAEWLDRIHDKVRRADPSTDAELDQLKAVLMPHNDKEENILYPAIGAQSGAEESARLFLAMEEIPQERFQTCCGAH